MLVSISPYMRFHLRQMARLYMTPYEWRGGHPYPKLAKSRRKWQDYRLWLYINLTYVLIMAGNFLRTKNELTVTQQMLALAFIFAPLYNLIWRLNFVWKEGELVHLLTSFVRFEEGVRPALVENGQFLTKLVALFGTITTPTLVVFASALMYARPCIPPALEYILLGGEGPCHPSLWLRIPVILFDAYIWLTNIATGTFFIFQACFGTMRCLGEYLRNVRQMLEGDSVENFRQGIRHYRQIQLLGVIFNDALQAIFFPFLLFALWTFFVVSMYGCVKLHEQIDMPEFALFPVMFADCIVGTFVIRVAANVIDQSDQCLGAGRRNVRFGSKVLFKRMIRSMARIGVRFGATNFVDQGTPFNLLNHGLDTCANLMLLS